MVKLNLEDKIRQLALPIVESKSLEIWGIEIEKGKRTLVRIYIDCSLDLCTEIARQLSLAIDANDIFPDHSVLEVSSPGLSRRFFKLSQMQNYINDTIEAKAIINDKRFNYKGILKQVNDKSFILSVNSEDIEINWINVLRVKRVHIFEMPVKPGKKQVRRNK